jgi:hypothetical protein
MTDVNPNRCGEPVNRPEGTLTLQDEEEVRVRPAIILSSLLPFFFQYLGIKTFVTSSRSFILFSSLFSYKKLFHASLLLFIIAVLLLSLLKERTSRIGYYSKRL